MMLFGKKKISQEYRERELSAVHRVRVGNEREALWAS